MHNNNTKRKHKFLFMFFIWEDGTEKKKLYFYLHVEQHNMYTELPIYIKYEKVFFSFSKYLRPKYSCS